MTIADDVSHCRKIRSHKDALALLRRRNGRYDRINARRCELIHKKYDNGLIQAEVDELDVLQKLTGRLIDLAHPRPLGNLRKLEKRLRDYNDQKKMES